MKTNTPSGGSSTLERRVAVHWLAAVVMACLVCQGAIHAQAYEPKAGSPERQAVCDGMREFMSVHLAQKPLSKPIVFKIHSIRILGDYYYIECLPLFKDGSSAIPEFLPDIGYIHCLERQKAGWKVVCDLSRTDVPSDAEVRKIKKALTSGFPPELLPEFWRDLFKKLK